MARVLSDFNDKLKAYKDEVSLDNKSTPAQAIRLLLGTQ